MNLIYTQSSGFVYSRYTDFTVPLMKRYADRIGADFIYDKSDKKPRYPLFEKYKVKNYLEKYDRVLFLDCDILIHPNSPNIFELVPKSHFAALSEGSYCNQEELFARWVLVKKASDFIGLPVDNFDIVNEYFNAGVFVADQIHKDIFEIPEPNVFMLDVTSEQNVLNIRIHHKKHKTFGLPNQYNYMPWKWSENHLQDGYFIHYAGMRSTLRYDYIKNDYQYLIETYG